MPELHYLLDTDWAINYLKGDDVTIGRIDGLLPQGVGLSVISLAELYEGLQVDEDQQNVFDDLLIGATAICNGLILLTNNHRHFSPNPPRG